MDHPGHGEDPTRGEKAALDPVTARLDAEHIAWETLACDPGDFRDCLRTLSPAVRRAVAGVDVSM